MLKLMLYNFNSINHPNLMGNPIISKNVHGAGSDVVA
jgi:hypothetical protein